MAHDELTTIPMQGSFGRGLTASCLGRTVCRPRRQCLLFPQHTRKLVVLASNNHNTTRPACGTTATATATTTGSMVELQKVCFCRQIFLRDFSFQSTDDDDNNNSNEQPEITFEEVEGKVVQILHENLIVILETPSKDRVKILGHLPSNKSVKIGSLVKARGRWKNHEHYGRQLECVAPCEVKDPTEEDTAETAYSGEELPDKSNDGKDYTLQKTSDLRRIPGIGKILEARIIEEYGQKDTLTAIAKEPERLQNVAGLRKSLAELILQLLPKDEDTLETISMTREYLLERVNGVGEVLAGHIVEALGNKAFEIISKDPLRLQKIKGINKSLADSIVNKVNKDKNVR